MGFLPLGLAWDDQQQRMRMGVAWYAVRKPFFYNWPEIKLLCVPFPLYVKATPATVVEHLKAAGNSMAVIELVEQWTKDPEGDYRDAFRVLIAARGACLATVQDAK